MSDVPGLPSIPEPEAPLVLEPIVLSETDAEAQAHSLHTRSMLLRSRVCLPPPAPSSSPPAQFQAASHATLTSRPTIDCRAQDGPEPRPPVRCRAAHERRRRLRPFSPSYTKLGAHTDDETSSSLQGPRADTMIALLATPNFEPQSRDGGIMEKPSTGSYQSQGKATITTSRRHMLSRSSLALSICIDCCQSRS